MEVQQQDFLIYQLERDLIIDIKRNKNKLNIKRIDLQDNIGTYIIAGKEVAYNAIVGYHDIINFKSMLEDHRSFQSNHNNLIIHGTLTNSPFFNDYMITSISEY